MAAAWALLAVCARLTIASTRLGSFSTRSRAIFASFGPPEGLAASRLDGSALKLAMVSSESFA